MHEPGGPTSYSTYGYMLVSAVLQAAAGRPYAGAMREMVFRPAGMTGIAIEGTEPMVASPVATFYFRPPEEGGAPAPTATEGINASCKFAGGILIGAAHRIAQLWAESRKP